MVVSAFAASLPVLHAASSAGTALPDRISFNRDVRPIMSDTCFHCHGFDAKSRKAGMRLDIREEALKPTKNDVVPIVPGKPDESEIILRIEDRNDPMPPEDAHKTLTAAQKKIFRQWVAEGAVYEPHWAYASLQKPAVPGGASSAPNPIDAFVRAKLAEKKLSPSTEAPKARLLRRLSLDLTGLPPTADEAAAYLADPSPGAYEQQVDRLLGSPRHGERMAVWWLDIARFADTVGFHGDQNQRIFPYRDYVISAFNQNKRFDQFTREQLAGDLLPSPTPEQLVATGYNRLNMMTREGGAQPREYLAKYGAERVRSVAAAWFGSTFGCAECHDHKFDPIKARDFYELQAFFADVKQWGVYSTYNYTPNPELAGFTNDHPFPPEIEVPSPYLQARRDRLRAELDAAQADARISAPAEAVQAWTAQTRGFLERNPEGWVELPVNAEPVEKSPPEQNNPAAVAGSPTPRRKEVRRNDSKRLMLDPEPGRVAALRLDVVTTDTEGAKAPTRAPLRLTATARNAAGRETKLDFVFADATTKEPRWDNGAEVIGIVSGWKLPIASEARLSGTWLLARPHAFESGDKLILSLAGDTSVAVRVFTSPLGAIDPITVASAETRAAIQSATGSAPTPALIDAWLLATGGNPAAFTRLHALAAQIRETRDGRAWSLITQPMEPIPVRVLARGNWQDESGPLVLPATPSFLPARRESTAEQRLTRLDLANWIVSAENPITARVVMNRLWAALFGTGLSAVIDDLGSQGELPSHPELLDWLASEFRDSGWDLRRMIRLIVTSATYRQSSVVRSDGRGADPANRLLAAQNPRRLEAEFVRDAALAAAGLLDLRHVGGPSAKPYQPPGYYAAIQFPNRDYVASKADEQWRRGVYMHWQRTFLHPMLANFDAPARDECAATRTVSNTPQQALTLLNDPIFVEAARVLAARIVAGARDDQERLRQAFGHAFGRAPKPAEAGPLLEFLRAQRAVYRAAPLEAEKLLRVGLAPAPVGDPVDLAAWTQVARALLNTQEFITRY